MRCNKILIGFGSSLYSEAEIDFTLNYLAQPNVLVVGAVLNDLQGVKEHQPCQKADCNGGGLACVQKKGQRDRNKMYDYLLGRCKEQGCKGVIHQEGGCNLDALIQETRYADLLVLWPETFLATTKNPQPLPVSRVLEKCSCPVLVLPAHKTKLEQVVMTFDGSARAMEGIKQFAYLLSGLSQKLPVTVLMMFAEGAGLSSGEEKLFIEYLKQHFRGLAVHRLCASSEHTLLTAVGLNDHALLVVNNPSPENLPLLYDILHGPATLTAPLRLYINGAVHEQEKALNA